MPYDNTMNVNSSSRDTALREVQRQIEEGLESARRGELLDGEAVMQELRERGAALPATEPRSRRVLLNAIAAARLQSERMLARLAFP